MTIVIQAREYGFRITGTSMAVVKTRSFDASAARTGSTSINVQLDTPDDIDDATWSAIVVASQGTSLKFLEDEPDLYDDDDGEPV